MTAMTQTIHAARRIAELEAARAADAQRITELQDRLDVALAERETAAQTCESLYVQVARLMAAPPPTPPEPQNPYTHVDDFMTGWFAPRAERIPGPRTRWCPHWWKHPEATEIITVMHAEFLRARQDPKLGPGAFLRNSFYPWLDRLTSPEGPFAACDPMHHEEPARLPVARSEVGWVLP